MEDKKTLIFFKAMTFKKLGRFTEAQNIYHNLLKKFHYQEGFKLMKNIVSMIMLPMTKDKRKQANYTQNLFNNIYMFQKAKVDETKVLKG